MPVTQTALTVETGMPPVITIHPDDTTIVSGEVPVFTAQAVAVPASTATWERSTDAGATWTPIAGAGVTSSDGSTGDLFHCTFTNSEGSVTTTDAMLTINTVPVITLHPIDQTVNAGAQVTLNTAATGSPAPTCQWEESADGGTTWTPMPAKTYPEVRFEPTIAMSGWQYRCVYTNSAGSTASNVAVVTVTQIPVVTLDPLDAIVTAGQPVTLTSAATGSPTPTAQWEAFGNGGVWEPIAGATTGSLTIASAIYPDDQKSYRCVWTNSVGSDTSASAYLTVAPPATPPVVTLDPVGYTGTPTAYTFTSDATGEPAPTPQWQFERPTSIGTWNNEGGADATTPAKTVNLTTTHNGWSWRCKWTNSEGEADSVKATVAVTAPVGIPLVTVQPVGGPAMGSNDTAILNCSATGDPAPTAEWQFSWENQGVWEPVTTATDVETPITGGTKSDISVPLNGADIYFRCQWSNSVGQTTSLVAFVYTVILVTTQPTDQSVAVGDVVTFTAEASEPTAIGHWERSHNTGAPFVAVAGGTHRAGGPFELSFAAAAADSGARFRCTFTNAAGNGAPVWSEPALLTVT